MCCHRSYVSLSSSSSSSSCIAREHVPRGFSVIYCTFFGFLSLGRSLFCADLGHVDARCYCVPTHACTMTLSTNNGTDFRRFSKVLDVGRFDTVNVLRACATHLRPSTMALLTISGNTFSKVLDILTLGSSKYTRALTF